MNSLSHEFLTSLISSLRLDFVFFKMETHMTFLDVPQAFPKAFLDGTNT